MEIKIEKLIFGGFGFGRDDEGKPVFVRKAVPGDLLNIGITKDKKSYKEGQIISILKPSPDRIRPRCPSADLCGGCEHQNISYKHQLFYKEEIFKETLRRAGIETDILPIVPGSDSEFYYRNTIRFFYKDNNGKISLAMHHFQEPGKLVETGECHLFSEWSIDFMDKFNNFLNSEINDKSAFFQLRLREGKWTGEKMIEIITKTAILPEKQKLTAFLGQFDFKSAYHTISAKNNLLDAKRSLLFGSPIIYEKIGKYTFQISPESFFQTNSMGVKTLYDKIKDFADIKIGDRVLDLYCGTGTIGIYLSTLAKEVVGVEEIQSAVNDAKANARINKVLNCNFISADAEKWLKQNKEQFDKIIVDPPREGLTKEIIAALSRLNFESLIYVSCNPATFARDIKELEKYGLKLKKVQPVDMFPQTHHIECVGLLDKK